MKTYSYEILKSRCLATELAPDTGRIDFMLKFFNEQGTLGKRMVFFQEGTEPGTVAAANGQSIGYYIVTALFESEVRPNAPSVLTV